MFIGIQILLKVLIVCLKHFKTLFQSLLFFFWHLFQFINLFLNYTMSLWYKEHLLLLFKECHNRFFRNTFSSLFLSLLYYGKCFCDYFLVFIIVGSFGFEFVINLCFVGLICFPFNTLKCFNYVRLVAVFLSQMCYYSVFWASCFLRSCSLKRNTSSSDG